jgi:hypothetical protein
MQLSPIHALRWSWRQKILQNPKLVGQNSLILQCDTSKYVIIGLQSFINFLTELQNFIT